MTKVINKALVSDIINNFEGSRVSRGVSPQRNPWPSVRFDIKPHDLSTRRNLTRPPPPVKSPRDKSATQFPLSPQSLLAQPRTQIHNENTTRVQCDFCGNRNLMNVHSCVNCGNPRSARWMKVW